MQYQIRPNISPPFSPIIEGRKKEKEIAPQAGVSFIFIEKKFKKPKGGGVSNRAAAVKFAVTKSEREVLTV